MSTVSAFLLYVVPTFLLLHGANAQQCSFGHCPDEAVSSIDVDETPYAPALATFHKEATPYAYVPWPIPRSRACTHVYSTHAILEPECTLPSACGTAIKARIDISWWGKEHTMCRGLEAQFTHSKAGGIVFSRHSTTVPTAVLYRALSSALSGPDMHDSHLYSDLLLAVVGTSHYIIESASLCNVVVISNSGKPFMAKHCFSMDADSAREVPVHPAYDASTHPVSVVGPKFALPAYIKAHTAGCFNVTARPVPRALNTSQGIFDSDTTNHCTLTNPRPTWGFTYRPAPAVVQSHYYTNEVSIPGLKWLESAITHVIEAVLYLFEELLARLVNILRHVHSRTRVPQMTLVLIVSFWFLPTRRAVLTTILYAACFGIHRD